MGTGQLFILMELLQECSSATNTRLEVLYDLLKLIKFLYKLIVVGSVLNYRDVFCEHTSALCMERRSCWCEEVEGLTLSG